MPFYKRLVLFRWMLSLFGAEAFENISNYLIDDDLEGYDEDNISRFVQALILHLPMDSPLTKEILLEYDQNIVRHWQAIAEPRSKGGRPIIPKYFQYLSLLFTEIYLDIFFQNQRKLLDDLNHFLATFNRELLKADRLSVFKPNDLNKLAFWNATGSGKTLLMHVNILQYRHYLEKNGKKWDLNRIILLTPNESLSVQHLEEFKKSRMQANLFRKDSSTPKLGMIEIIDIHKLKDESKEKTVAVDSFEGNNLVLVDEGHKGSGGKEWLEKRNKLCEEGFSFEYSATFGQALKAANKKALTEQYAKCILFDYSYRYFYKDGYGKNYKVLNLADTSDDARMQLYLTACLLSFYQQVLLYEDGYTAFRPFNIHRPLWVFVGSKVNAVRTEQKQKVSDVTAVLRFLSIFTTNREQSVEALDRILKGHDGLTDAAGRSIFATSFAPLHGTGLSAEDFFDDILKRVFHARVPGKVHVEHLKGGDGEIALKLGEGNNPFGVINVGDAKQLWKLCDDLEELVTMEKDFSESLFRKINDEKGGINLLIGSKKFTEGWNSWRVSTMGLMNIGRSEGSEIVQLFGRGVRLKGYNFCLKRSSEVRGVKKPEFMRLCETLNIFGVRADYMQQFKEYLEEEGLPQDVEEMVLPVIKNLGKVKLKVPKVPGNINFKQQEKVCLDMPPEHFANRPITLDWYPKIQALVSGEEKEKMTGEQKHEVRKLGEKYLAFVRWDEVFFELVRYKNERGWHNLSLSKPILSNLLLQGGWYRILVPQEDIEPTCFLNIRRCQEIAVALLKKYCNRFYTYKKDEFEKPFMEYGEIGQNDPNFFDEYRIAIDRSLKTIIKEIEAIQEAVKDNRLEDMEFPKMHSINFLQHVYHPLLHIKGDCDGIKVSPVALNEGEKDFVTDLRTFYEQNGEWFQKKELYLLRNLSKGKGIGFFEAENFYPDFILWLVQGEDQHIAFVDPKGILRLQGLNDPKIMFHQKIKELQERLGDDHVTMTSFIVSNSPLEAVKWWSGGDALEFNKRNVLFQNEDKDVYVKMLLERMTQ